MLYVGGIKPFFVSSEENDEFKTAELRMSSQEALRANTKNLHKL